MTRLTTIQPGENDPNADDSEIGVVNSDVAVDPMSEAERAFLEENYRCILEYKI